MRKLILPLPDLLLIPIGIELVVSVLMLRSIASFVFPQYFIYMALALIFFILFQKIDFDTLATFAPLLYVGSIILLILPIVLGVVTRGTIRWIPLGSFNLQPAEFVRPFLILFFAVFFASRPLTLTRLITAGILMLLPLVLIFLQPSLGVTILTLAGFAGVVYTMGIKRKYIFWGIIASIFALPLLWFVMAPYQKERVLSLVAPHSDPTGAGYNSIQSMIAVGSGKFRGRGLGNGVQTQLSFLPEKHTDFMFAAISEELGFIGALLTLGTLTALLLRLTTFIDHAQSHVRRAFVTGVFCTMFLQVVIHVGMNMGMLPITGLPLPLVSYGGSSLLSTMIMLGLALQAGAKSATIQSI